MSLSDPDHKAEDAENILKSSKSVCWTCLDLDMTNREREPEIFKKRSVQMLMTSSSSCFACKAIFEGLSAHVKQPEKTPSLLLKSNGAGPLLVTLNRRFGYIDEDCITVEFYIHINLPKPWPSIGPARTRLPSFTLEDTRLISQWLDECANSHQLCAISEKSTLPTRVLAVGSNFQEPYLLDETGDESAPYIALSHCWGDKDHPPLTTTIETLEEHKRSIPLSKLPQTFRDAVLLARNIGFKYIWIDSLCIIQDEPSDWLKESARMAGVYERAILTVSADGARNSHEGLFGAVNNKRSFASPLAIHSPGIPEGSEMYARLTSLGDTGNRVHSIASPTSANLLPYRGWALQEWLLSPRVVHFATGELLWECKTHQKCECQTIPQLGWGKEKGQGTRNQSKTDYFELHGGVGKQQTLIRWDEVVEEFTQRRLTVPTDTLPALSGLAEAINAQTQSGYIGGLWKESIPESLLWDANRDELEDYRGKINKESDPTGTRRRDYSYAPSWSWASITGCRISFFHCSSAYESLTKVLEVSGEPLNPVNRFGPFSSSFVKLKGFLATIPGNIRWREEPETDISCNVEGYYIWGKLILDVTNPGLEIASMDEVVIIIINRDRNANDSTELCGLALKGTKKKSCFRRVGLVWLMARGPDPKYRDSPPNLDTWISRILKAKKRTITIV